MDKKEFLEKISPHVHSIASELFDEKFGKEPKKRESWYASDVLKCPLGVYLDRTDPTGKKETPLHAQNTMFEGKLKELELLLRLTLEGTTILDTQRRLYNKELDVSGRPDAIIELPMNPVLPGKRIMVEEIKTVNSRSFWYRVDRSTGTFTPYLHHVLQLTFYLHELRQEFPDIMGRIRYRSRDDGTEQLIMVPYKEENWKQVTDYFGVLNNHIGKSSRTPFHRIPADNIVQNEQGVWEINWAAKYCDYHHRCVGDDNWLEQAKKKVAELNGPTRAEKKALLHSRLTRALKKDPFMQNIKEGDLPF